MQPKVSGVTTVYLSPSARASLNLARAVAALYVVFHHVSAAAGVHGPLGWFASFGQEAVMVFFVLSGFVIWANEIERVAQPRGYYLRRLRRIYPPIFGAMLIGLALAAFNLSDARVVWSEAWITVFSLQDIASLKPGVIGSPFLGNTPLWSLSYEVFFYMVFPLVAWAWRKSRVRTRHAVGVTAVLGFIAYAYAPNHFALMASYFLLWWLGAMAAHAHAMGGISLLRLGPEIFWVTVLGAVALANVLRLGHTTIGTYPALMPRHYFVGLALIALAAFGPLRRVTGVVALSWEPHTSSAASIAYGLYVLHVPIMVQTGTAGTWWMLLTLPLLVGGAWVIDVGLGRVLPRAPRD